MYSSVVWKSGMEFDGQAGAHTVPLDAKAPIGKESGPTPKELVAMGMGGCTAMDVIALLKKYKQLPRSLKVDVDIQSSTGKQPAVFEKAELIFTLEGEIENEKVLEAVHLSQTKFCGVNAMLSKSFPISYRVVLNGLEIGKGEAKFD